MSLVVDEHREYLADTVRVAAFDAALRALVRPGDVVLDLASGTGILGLLALRAGAAHVYAIESEPIAGLARRIVRDNGLADRITILQTLSSRATLPQPVDLIVTDLAGRFGFEAGLIEVLGDARRRFLKPGGRIIPASVTLWLAPVEVPDVRRHVDFWAAPIAGVSFAAAHAIARGTGYPRHLTPGDLLDDPVRLTTVDLSNDTDVMSGRTAFVVKRAGTFDGIGGWFAAVLAPGVELTNAPGSADRVNRRNVFFPLRDAVAVRAGDTVSVSMVIRPEVLIVRWRVEIRRDAAVIHITTSSTFEGMLVSQSDVEHTRPSSTPVLTASGEARRTVLDLCDGARTLREIEAAVFESHPALFRTHADAAAFVAEVLARYAV
ncbi:MAG: putative methylase [Acidobacteria bacterium]|nr:putative methylase [Acidobacteriota bacterium]